LRGVRNAKYELVGVEPVSQEEYDQRTAKIKAFSKYMSGAIQENTGYSLNNRGSAAIEVGDPNYVDNSLNAYTYYGVSYDRTNKQWVFNNKPIHFLIDGEHATFINNSEDAIKNGISLKVVRKANGEIDKLIEIEMTEEEVEAILK